MQQELEHLLKRLISKNGEEAQLLKSIEELSELSKEIIKYLYLKKTNADYSLLENVRLKIQREFLDATLSLKYIDKIFKFEKTLTESERREIFVEILEEKMKE